MLDRVDMDVVDVTCEIVLVADRMLPKSALPNTSLAFGKSAVRNMFVRGQIARKARLNQPSAISEVTITIGHCPHSM